MHGNVTLAQSRRNWVALLIAASVALHSSQAAAQAEQRTLVTSAALTLTEFLADPDMSWLQLNLSRAKAVLIAPGIIKAALVVGGSGGRAVAVAHDPKTGHWVGPAFYTLLTASVGLQAGVSSSDVVTLVMTDVGLQRLLSNTFHLGSDVSIAIGPVGRGTRTELVADFVSFSRSAGGYVGLDLGGTVVRPADDWNQLYYGRAVAPSDILVREAVHNRQANELLGLLATATKN
jgi:lipid-binding SYLF domain-containing protein